MIDQMLSHKLLDEPVQGLLTKPGMNAGEFQVAISKFVQHLLQALITPWQSCFHLFQGVRTMLANSLQATFVLHSTAEILSRAGYQLFNLVPPVRHNFYDMGEVLHDRPLVFNGSVIKLIWIQRRQRTVNKLV